MVASRIVQLLLKTNVIRKVGDYFVKSWRISRASLGSGKLAGHNRGGELLNHNLRAESKAKQTKARIGCEGTGLAKAIGLDVVYKMTCQ